MKTHCLNHSNKPIHARGLCRRCFNYASLRVRLGQWTWPQLEEQGKALPPVKRGPKAPDWAKDVV